MHHLGCASDHGHFGGGGRGRRGCTLRLRALLRHVDAVCELWPAPTARGKQTAGGHRRCLAHYQLLHRRIRCHIIRCYIIFAHAYWRQIMRSWKGGGDNGRKGATT